MIIFLDIDGVLNDREFRLKGLKERNYSVLIDPNRVVLLKEIIDSTGAKIILSSSWNKFWDYNPVDCAGKQINEALSAHGLRVEGKTPWIRDSTRNEEIEAWLREHSGVSSYVILDDNEHAWSKKLRSHWVKTDSDTGLNAETVATAIAVLRGNLLPVPKENNWKKLISKLRDAMESL